MSTLRNLPECLDGELPLAVRAIDLESGLSHVSPVSARDGRKYKGLLGLVRSEGRPLGWVSAPISHDGTVHLEGELATAEDELAWGDSSRGASGSGDVPGDLGCLFSVVIATCADSQATLRCVEAIHAAGVGQAIEVIVVENRPERSRVAVELRRRFGAHSGIRYVQEHRPGLGAARNAGLRVARGELIAFTDDDVTVDVGWLAALRSGFVSHNVSCVTGLIAPLEFETAAQIHLERFAGYAKGFVARIYSLAQPPAGEPLFPYAAGHFASGANMAFKTRTLREIGGFDPCLGTGTPARGCEDLDVCIRLLQAGHRLAYEPRAIIWHRHPDTEQGFRRRVFDYGVALGAMLTKHLVCGSDRWGIASRAAQGAAYFVSPRSRKNAGRGASFPAHLKCLELVGVAYGPLAYLASRISAR